MFAAKSNKRMSTYAKNLYEIRIEDMELMTQQAEVAEKAAAAARADYIKALQDQNATSLREIRDTVMMLQTAGQDGQIDPGDPGSARRPGAFVE